RIGRRGSSGREEDEACGGDTTEHRSVSPLLSRIGGDGGLQLVGNRPGLRFRQGEQIVAGYRLVRLHVDRQRLRILQEPADRSRHLPLEGRIVQRRKQERQSGRDLLG